MNTVKLIQDSLDKTIAMVGAIAHLESELKVIRRSMGLRCKTQMTSTLQSLGALSTCLEQQQCGLETELRRARSS